MSEPCRVDAARTEAKRRRGRSVTITILDDPVIPVLLPAGAEVWYRGQFVGRTAAHDEDAPADASSLSEAP